MASKAKISRAQYEAAYQKGRDLYEKDEESMSAALAELGKTKINPSSARNYIYNLRRMLRGEVYKRAMSVQSTDDFLGWIYRDYREPGLAKALSALEKHIPYHQEDNSNPMTGHFALLEKYGRYLKSEKGEKSAVNDLVDPPPGNVSPDRAERISIFIRRDQKVRDYVIKRANGKCEYCGHDGFLLPNGNKYLESHHVISLADEGADTVDNVIALCANHHREAHFGAEAGTLEQNFIERIASRNSHSGDIR